MSRRGSRRERATDVGMGEDVAESLASPWGLIGLGLVAGGIILAVLSRTIDGWPGPVGALAILVGIATMATSMARFNRRAADAMRRLKLGYGVPPDIHALRHIESVRRPKIFLTERFPSGIKLSREIAHPVLPVRFAVNVPEPDTKRQSPTRMEIPATYIWARLPYSLPRLAIDIQALPSKSALSGRDVDFENEDFNRRFRVTDGGSGMPPAEFAQYAHTLLHPRAAEAVLRLPIVAGVVIDDDLIFSLDGAPTGQPRIEAIARVITDLAALIPEHVVHRWGERRAPGIS